LALAALALVVFGAYDSYPVNKGYVAYAPLRCQQPLHSRRPKIKHKINKKLSPNLHLGYQKIKDPHPKATAYPRAHFKRPLALDNPSKTGFFILYAFNTIKSFAEVRNHKIFTLGKPREF